MMIKRKHLILALLLMVAPLAAQTFHTVFLQKAYTHLNLKDQVPARELKSGVSLYAINTQNIIMRVSDKGEVEHIGIPLFSADMQRLMPSPVYDCLEQMLLDYVYHISENTLPREHLIFDQGSWRELLKVTTFDECQIENLDDKFYIVRWMRDGNPWLSLRCPVNYELLAGSTRREMEQIFLRELKAYVSTSEVEKQIDPSIPLLDIKLTLMLYGNHRESLNLNMKQLVAYCQSVGCKTQLVLDKPEGETGSALLYLRNQASGYSHLLHLKNMDQQGKISGSLSLYIPINNVEDLFATPPAKSTPKRF